VNDGTGGVGNLLVLGGGSDIGLATAAALVERGTRRVVLAARDPAKLGPAVKRLRALGASSCEARSFDAESFGSHADFVDDVFDTQDIDLAMLAFGVLGDQAVAEKDPSAAVAIAQTNYVGAVSVLTSLARRMDEQGHGTIVVLSSVAGERGRRSNYVYGSSKAGLDVYCQGLGDRLRDRGVRVVIVRPGFVRSKMTLGSRPIPLSTTPGAVADAIVRALEGGADLVWVPGTLRFIMSGLRHLPRPVFRRLPI
jgi:decaprenylphospho-beta-D-erythro-pentofuranosid-2-ulose 2-reductase